MTTAAFSNEQEFTWISTALPLGFELTDDFWGRNLFVGLFDSAPDLFDGGFEVFIFWRFFGIREQFSENVPNNEEERYDYFLTY